MLTKSAFFYYLFIYQNSNIVKYYYNKITVSILIYFKM